MRFLQFSILSLLLCACSSQKYAIQLTSEQREILNSIVGKKVHQKTIISEFDEPISKYVEDNFLAFNLCSKEFGSQKVQITDEELEYLKNQFDRQTIINLNRLNPKLRIRASRKRERFKSINISLPVVFRGDSLGLYYVSGTHAGEFSLLQKKNNNWEKACSSLVWIE